MLTSLDSSGISDGWACYSPFSYRFFKHVEYFIFTDSLDLLWSPASSATTTLCE
jgi:hypothetical protein